MTKKQLLDLARNGYLDKNQFDVFCRDDWNPDVPTPTDSIAGFIVGAILSSHNEDDPDDYQLADVVDTLNNAIADLTSVIAVLVRHIPQPHDHIDVPVTPADHDERA